MPISFSMGKKKEKATKKRKLVLGDLNPKNCKTKCCKKYKKKESKRCKRCPCYDLLKKVA